MRFILAPILGAALLGAGCNSDPAQPPPEADAGAEATTATASQTSRPGFQSAPDASEASVHASADAAAQAPRLTTKKSPFPVAANRDAAPVEVEPIIQQAETSGDTNAVPVNPEDIPQEGDETLVPPKLLGVLLPGFNFETVEREAPINVKSLLEQQGIVLTNYQQLVEMGLTNYQIVRAQKPAEDEVAR